MKLYISSDFTLCLESDILSNVMCSPRLGYTISIYFGSPVATSKNFPLKLSFSLRVYGKKSTSLKLPNIESK